MRGKVLNASALQSEWEGPTTEDDGSLTFEQRTVSCGTVTICSVTVDRNYCFLDYGMMRGTACGHAKSYPTPVTGAGLAFIHKEIEKLVVTGRRRA